MTYVYGLFNDKEIILAANEVTEGEEKDWSWLWDTSMEEYASQIVASQRACEVENHRDKKFGPVIIMRRMVPYGDWQVLNEE